MAAPCHGRSRVCSYHQDRGLCGRCPNRTQFTLPAALRPLSNRQIVFGFLVCLVLLGLTACGGGQAGDPEQRKDEPSPNCAMRPETCR